MDEPEVIETDVEKAEKVDKDQKEVKQDEAKTEQGVETKDEPVVSTDAAADTPAVRVPLAQPLPALASQREGGATEMEAEAAVSETISSPIPVAEEPKAQSLETTVDIENSQDKRDENATTVDVMLEPEAEPAPSAGETNGGGSHEAEQEVVQQEEKMEDEPEAKPKEVAFPAADAQPGPEGEEDALGVQSITENETHKSEETNTKSAEPESDEQLDDTPDIAEAMPESAIQAEAKAVSEIKAELPAPVPAPSAAKSPPKQTAVPNKSTPRQTRAATTPSKTPSSASQTPLKAQRTGGLPLPKPSTPSVRAGKSSAPPTSFSRTSPQAQSKPTTPSAIPRTTRKSLTPSSRTTTPLKPSHTGSTVSPSPAQMQPLKPHHTGAVTPLRPQVTGTRAIERSPLYAPTASSLAKTKQKVAASPSPVGGKTVGGGTARKESVGSASEAGAGSVGSRARVVSSSGSGTSGGSRQRTTSGEA